MNRFTAGLMAAASAAALAVLPGAASASASTGWSAQTTPSPPGALSAELSGVACGSPADCTAVGSYDTTSGTVNLAERYNGSTWAIQFTPDSGSGDSLSGVACISAADCIAVGSTGYGTDPLIESWNGTAWTIDTIPPGGGSLKEIKCFGAADCIAVGWNSSSNTPLIESWNGTSWTVQAVPSGVQGSLFGISCVTASSCYASGDYENGRAKPLLLHWNGTAWAAQASPALPKVEGVKASGVGLYSIACYGSDCTAAGGAFYWEGTPEASVTTTLVERWNGSAWSIEKTVNPSGESGERRPVCGALPLGDQLHGCRGVRRRRRRIPGPATDRDMERQHVVAGHCPGPQPRQRQRLHRAHLLHDVLHCRRQPVQRRLQQLVTAGAAGRAQLAPERGKRREPGGRSGGESSPTTPWSVMVAGCEDDDLCFGDDVDEAVLVVDPS